MPKFATNPAAVSCCKFPLRLPAFLFAPALLLLAGCNLGNVAANPSNKSLSIAPFVSAIDTNCTGCNALNAGGAAIHQFHAQLPDGTPAAVQWSLSGGDPVSGTGAINAAGQYTPPTYLTADRVSVLVTATLPASAQKPAATATAVINISPGFLQPLTPENAALGANGSVTVTGWLAEAGGGSEIHFSLANSANGTSGGAGTLSAANCRHASQSFTYCSVTYTAPGTLAAQAATYVLATVSGSSAAVASRVAAPILLNAAGVSSNPALHQAQMTGIIQLGSSGGNNADFDTHGTRIVDCCSGTLGALVADSTGRQYLLSNNHVLARSDQAGVGDAIVQPGLIDNNCNPQSAAAQPVATLTGWLPLASRSTNADAAIAQVASRAIDATGGILELGERRADGTLAAAPPGISSTGGKGEAAGLDLRVAKSGRTTGLTCGSVSAVDVDVTVDYFTDCAETHPYLTRTFTRQLALSGNAFSDAGDSGALIVDAANAEPVGLFFAGGTDAAGVSQGMANPAQDVLNELDSQLSPQLAGQRAFSFVGGADHPVQCLNYGDSTVVAAQSASLSAAETARGQRAVVEAHGLINPSSGILSVASGKSTDRAGETAVIVYVDESRSVTVPATVGGVRTVVIPTTARAVNEGKAPLNPMDTVLAGLANSALNQAIAAKDQVAGRLMKRTPAFFAVGVGRSFDNPKEAAMVIYVDRRQAPGDLPAVVNGLRARYIVMDRLHVTRSYATPNPAPLHCLAHPILEP